jgi:hypothetical protein
MPELIWLLVAIVVLIAVAWGAKYVIDTFFPPPIHTPALLVVGLILLIFLVYILMRYLPGLPGPR